ncbi:NAD(P)/FAD-dependent oxidoreductase [Nonomuraea roseoviolacea]|uniref:NADH dehydrogenase n=1 Tax=Nonomuraea roseoviolacea subsp. carminata TaxID=160689 RepID=A0ABT1K3W5_9ACTN|nr:FAD-dependent oxidoreductase [Nonomuraea roseoviolacea]MCP2348690.1 NADH dehydrogenase [Nonomuraea roseoviolacea subsp. carminata]
MDAHSTPHEIVVIGGGYAGTVAANHLRLRTDVAITLVNPRPTFVERIRLHQFAAGNYDAAVDYGTLLGDGVRLVVDSATRIDSASRTVELASGDALDYDYVIYAVGSTGAIPSSVPGAAEFAYSVAEFEFAERLRARLAEPPADAAITVVGGGLTGVETAAELADQGRAVTLICGGVLAPALTAPARRSVATWLSEHGVTVLEGDPVTQVRQDAVVLTGGTPRPSALTVWTAGFGVPGLAAASGLSVDPLGRLLTDETLVSVDDDRVVGAGDAASPSGRPLRMRCQAAMPLGIQAADAVLSRIAGTAPAVIDQAFKSTCISLGRHAATMQYSRPDDTPLDTFIDGQKAAEAKEELCRRAVMGISMEGRSPGAVVWQKAGPRAARMVA